MLPSDVQQQALASDAFFFLLQAVLVVEEQPPCKITKNSFRGSKGVFTVFLLMRPLRLRNKGNVNVDPYVKAV